MQPCSQHTQHHCVSVLHAAWMCLALASAAPVVQECLLLQARLATRVMHHKLHRAQHFTTACQQSLGRSVLACAGLQLRVTVIPCRSWASDCMHMWPCSCDAWPAGPCCLASSLAMRTSCRPRAPENVRDIPVGPLCQGLPCQPARRCMRTLLRPSVLLRAAGVVQAALRRLRYGCQPGAAAFGVPAACLRAAVHAAHQYVPEVLAGTMAAQCSGLQALQTGSLLLCLHGAACCGCCSFSLCCCCLRPAGAMADPPLSRDGRPSSCAADA